MDPLAIDRMFDSIVREGLEEKAPAVLYHYTTWGGADGILSAQHFRATAHHSTNDPAELSTADDVIVGVAGDLMAQASGVPQTVLQLFIDGYSAMRVGRLMTVYLACFSAARDDPDQWRKYGDGGRGLCLGVRILDEPGPKSPDLGSGLLKVDYSETSWRQKLKVNFRQILSFLEKVTPARRNIELGLNALYRIAAFAAIAAKREQWAVEQEYRHVTLLHKDARAEPKWRESNGKRIPYLEVRLRDGGRRIALAEIIIGPSQDAAGATERVQAILDKAGYHVGEMESPNIVVSSVEPGVATGSD